jgi:hypothetical protein
MKIDMIIIQAVNVPAALFLLYWFVVRRWRRDRELGVDGLLVVAFATLWFEDPMSAYGGTIFTYNTWLIQFGSWVHDVPGWLSFGRPGHMIPEPLFIPFLYVWFFLLPAVGGCWVMRRAKARWPRMGVVGLLGICFGALCIFDLVVEGILFLPLGVWEYPGGSSIALFPSTYHKYPINEMLTIAAECTLVAALRYFLDDKGHTIVERGIDRVRTTPGRKLVLRALAVIAATHVIVTIGYNIPNGWMAVHSPAWPADLQKRSYLTDGICGAGTDRACPGPAVPLIRNDNSGGGGGSAYMSPTGRLVVPPGTRLPKLVPFEKPSG